MGSCFLPKKEEKTMGYYASGAGSVLYKSILDEHDKKIIDEVFDEDTEFYDHEIDDSFKGRTLVYFRADDKYHDEETLKTLRALTEIAPVENGALEYFGEDGQLWRFVWKDDKWVEEDGHVEYSRMTFDRLKEIFMAYVMNDLESADSGYVRETLTGVCGIKPDEIAELGLDALFEGGEADA